MAQKNRPQPSHAATPQRAANATRTPEHGSSTVHETVAAHDDAARDSWLGTDRGHRPANVSWGAIFAGVVTFLAVLVLLGLLAAALGLSDASGTAVGIWSAITLILGLAAAGFVAGSLAVRGGLLHGLVTWATSLVGLLVAVSLLGASVLGALGGVVGGVVNTAAQATNISTEDVANAAEEADAQVSDQDVQNAQDQAQQAADDATQTFEESRDEIAAGAWWGFAGLLIGAAVASLAGVAGARAVHRRETELRTETGRRVDA